MRAEEKTYDGEIFGIELTAESAEEEKIIRRFWEGGIKINGLTTRGIGSSLELTFADLIGRKD